MTWPNPEGKPLSPEWEDQEVGERSLVLKQLAQYHPIDQTEEIVRQEAINFILQNPNCFQRMPGAHVVVSGWVVSEDFNDVLLTHHRKLDKWLQLGGHPDGDPDIFRVASRETKEETSLASLKIWKPQIFDLDKHRIPAYKNEPEHDHYDIRILLVANRHEQPVQVPRESKGLAWTKVAKIASFNGSDPSLSRMAMKTLQIKILDMHQKRWDL